MSTQTVIQNLRQQLVDIRARRAAVIEASTKRKLELLDDEERDVHEALASAELLESRAKHSIPPSAEENELWEQIRDLMRQEAALLREKMVPEKYVRPDAVEHFAGDLAERVAAFEKDSAGLKFNQSHGARIVEKRRALKAEQEAFAKTIKPFALVGQKLYGIRERIKTLNAQRDALKAERESKGLASVK